MIPTPKLVQPRRQNAPGGSPAVDWLVGMDARDLNGNGDGNAGWTDGDLVNLTTRRVANTGLLGGFFTQPVVADGWHYEEDAGDGEPALVNDVDDRTRRMTLEGVTPTQLAVLGPDSGPYSIQIVARCDIDAIYSDGTFATTQRNVGAGLTGYGFAFYAPWDGGFPFGQIGQRGTAFGSDGVFAGFAGPPDGVMYAAGYENEGGIAPNTIGTWVDNVLGTLGDSEGPASFTPGTASEGPMTLGGGDTSTAHPLRGGIRLFRCWATTGHTEAFYNYAVSQNLI